jgi:hypothetical protein
VQAVALDLLIPVPRVKELSRGNEIPPNEVFGNGPNFIVESGIAEWQGRNGAVLRISEDEKVQGGTLVLSVPPK